MLQEDGGRDQRPMITQRRRRRIIKTTAKKITCESERETGASERPSLLLPRLASRGCSAVSAHRHSCACVRECVSVCFIFFPQWRATETRHKSSHDLPVHRSLTPAGEKKKPLTVNSERCRPGCLSAGRLMAEKHRLESGWKGHGGRSATPG